ncbi:MAG: ABC transporter permease, partial [Lachnospiraceae bacterium]|nr:ABC transporter permease [Lachnospiraceae bacterium]
MPSVLLAYEAKNNQTKIGDTLTLELGERSYKGNRLSQNNEYMDDEYEDDETFTVTGTRTFTVVGIYSTWPNVSYWAPGYDVLAGPIEEETEYQDVFLELKHPRQAYDFTDETLAQKGATIMYNDSLLRWLGVADNSNLNVVLTGLLTILILVIMTGSITLIYNAFSISLRERTVQFGLLSSIGATKKQLRRAMRYEAFFVSAVGIPLGILAGVGGIGVTLHYIGSGLTNWIHGTKSGIPLYVPVWAVAAAAVIAFVTIMISVWIPSRRIRKITPMEAIRSSTDICIKPNEVKTRKWTLAVFGLEGMMAQKNYKRDRRKYRATVISLTMSIGLFTAAGLFNMYLLETGAFVLEAPETDLEYTLYTDVGEREPDMENILQQTKGIRSVSKYYTESCYFKIPEEWAQTGLLSICSEELDLADETKGDTWINASIFILGDKDFRQFAREQKVDLSAYQDSDHVKALYLNTTKYFNPETERYEKQAIFPEMTDRMFDAGYIDYDDEGKAARYDKTMELELS